MCIYYYNNYAAVCSNSKHNTVLCLFVGVGEGGGCVCESRGWYLISYLQLNVYCLLAYLLMFIYLYLFNELILYVFIYLIFMDRFVFAVHQPFYYTAYAAHYVYMYVCTVY